MRSSGPIWWFGLGRILPRKVRQRIFEPACHDLFIDWVRSAEKGRSLYAMRAFSLLVCSGFVGSRLFVFRCLLWITGGISLILTLILIAMLNNWFYAPGY